MTRMLQISALIVAGSMTLLPWIAQAQVRCAAGAAVNGDCVNEAMARSALQAAVIFSQPKISYTAFPCCRQPIAFTVILIN